MAFTETEKHKREPGIRSYWDWLRTIPVSLTTGWRWRKQGWISCVNIAGKCYVTDQAIFEFMARAERGEFSRSAVGAAKRSAETRAAKGEPAAENAAATTEQRSQSGPLRTPVY